MSPRLTQVLVQNFVLSIIDAEYSSKLAINGSTTRLGELDRDLNLFFTAIFTLELAINAYANWFHRLVSSGCQTLIFSSIRSFDPCKRALPLACPHFPRSLDRAHSPLLLYCPLPYVIACCRR